MPQEYPVLDNRPINKWKVTELREELKKRNLSIKGLKEALVNRLDEAIQKEMEEQEIKGKGSESESESDLMPSDCVQNDDDAQKHIANEICEAEDTVAKNETSDCPKETGSAKYIDNVPTGSSVQSAMDEESKDLAAPSEVIPPVDATDKMTDVIASTEKVPEDRVEEDEDMKSSQYDDVETKMVSSEVTSESNALENCNVVPDTSGEITTGQKCEPEEGFKNLTKMDAEPVLSHPSTVQVLEVIPSLGSQVKSDSIHTDTLPLCVTNQLNDDLNPDNVQLEQESVRSEMVLPSSSKDLPAAGIDHPMDDKMPSKTGGLVGGTDEHVSSNVNHSMTNENMDQSLVVDAHMVEHNKASNSTELLEGLSKDDDLNGADLSCKEMKSPEKKIDAGEFAKEINVKGISVRELNMDENDSHANDPLDGLSKDENQNEDSFSCKVKDSHEGKIDVGTYVYEAISQDVSAFEHKLDHNTSISTERLGGFSKDANLNEDKFSCKDKESSEGVINIDSSTKESNLQDVSMTGSLDGISKDANVIVDKVLCEEKDSSAGEKTEIESADMETDFQEHNKESSAEEKTEIKSSNMETDFQDDIDHKDSSAEEKPKIESSNMETNFQDVIEHNKNSSVEEKTEIESSNMETSLQDVIEHNMDCYKSNGTERLEEGSKYENLNDSTLSGKEKESSEDEKFDVGASTQEVNIQAEAESTDSGLGKVTDVAGENLEKINLDQSSADDSMDEDLADPKNIDSEHISFEVPGKKAEDPFTEEPKLELEGISNPTDPSDIPSALEDKKQNLNLPEKRKFQDATTLENKEPAKRQRKWNYESLKTSEPKNSSILLLTPKQSSTPNFTSNNSTILSDAPKERIVPESSRTPTDSLRIDNFVRPFTLKAVQELLGQTGKLCSFWMDHIKTHCYVTFSSVEEAIETRKAVHNLQWPINGGRCLVADFVTPEEVKSKVDVGPTRAAAPKAPPQPLAAQQKGGSGGHHPLSRQRAPQEEAPLPTLDELFRKTKTTPRIYYLPLTDEQVATKRNKQTK